MAHQRCAAFRCAKPARVSLCPRHMALLPEPLRREFEAAIEDGRRQKKVTARFRAAFENAFRFLAQRDVEEAKAQQAEAAKKAAVMEKYNEIAAPARAAFEKEKAEAGYVRHPSGLLVKP